MVGPDPDSLALGRARRRNAGNRLRALLDGVFETEEGFEEMENDEEFEDKGDEGDEYASDFQSTDEEAGGEDGDAGEKQIQLEAREARKSARRKADLAGHAMGGAKSRSVRIAYENGDGEPTTKKRKLNLPLVINKETGEVVDMATRKSSRRATVRNKRELQSKLKEEEQKKAALPKREKVQQRAKTQDELIREALETEEGNIHSLNTFLTEEEERQLKNAQLKKAAVEGPLLRWISRGEKVRVPMVVEVEVPPYILHRRPVQATHKPSPLSQSTPDIPPFPSYPNYSSNHISAPVTQSPSVPPSTSNGPSMSKDSLTSSEPSVSSGQYPVLNNNGSPLMEPIPVPSIKPATQPTVTATWNGPPNSLPTPPSSTTTASTSTSTPIMPPLPKPPSSPSSSTTTPNHLSGPSSSLVSQTRNYIVLEAQGATPQEDMQYLFGDHVEWGSLKVLPKNHPSTRKVVTCAVTGLTAKYVEPKSGIPFADGRAYRIISRLLMHKYVWSEPLGAYIGDEDRRKGAAGVPSGWENAIIGIGS